jgi:hypothetical protein
MEPRNLVTIVLRLWIGHYENGVCFPAGAENENMQKRLLASPCLSVTIREQRIALL